MEANSESNMLFIEIIRTHIPKEEAKLSTVVHEKPEETDDLETSLKNKKQKAKGSKNHMIDTLALRLPRVSYVRQPLKIPK